MPSDYFERWDVTVGESLPDVIRYIGERDCDIEIVRRVDYGGGNRCIKVIGQFGGVKISAANANRNALSAENGLPYSLSENICEIFKIEKCDT